MSHEEAFRILLAHVAPLGIERVPLASAFGKWLAQDVRADRDLPAADQSAMDGYALKASDVAKAPAKLRLVGEVAAGSPERPRVRGGTCVRILTGASVPPGADTVVKVEDTQSDGDEVEFLSAARRGANIRRKGESAKKGAVVLASGARIDRLQASICGAFGKTSVAVRRRPSVAVVVTGKEVLPVGSRVKPHQVRDSNGPAVLAALAAAGCGDAPVTIAPDDPKKLEAILRNLISKAEVIIVTGGVSVGRYDYVPAVVRALGAREHFHGVTIKPGKPQLYATIGRNRHIFGLPGNPLSVMSGMHEFVLPALRLLGGCPAEVCRPELKLPLAGDAKSRGSRTQFALARLVNRNGITSALPVKSLGSADITAAGSADGIVIVPMGTTRLARGTVAVFRPWRTL